MKLADLMKSFDERADKMPKGRFWLTEKQFNFAKDLANQERISIEQFHNFRTWAVGKNAEYWSSKHFAHGDGRNTLLPGRWAEEMKKTN
jgi:hypothetical protein